MRHLTILQVNDLHGYLTPHPELFDLTNGTEVASGGGLARIAAMHRAVRREGADAVLAFDNGDTFHGTLPAVRSRGEALLRPMAALGLDAMTVHWEFAYGLQRVRELARALPYPMLAANLRDGTGTLALAPYRIIDRGGVRTAVVGLAASIAGHLLPADERPHVTLTMGEAELRALVPELRGGQRADVVIVLSHLGFPQDCKLAAAVPGIDVILSGHTHNRMDAPALVGETIVMQSGAHGSFIGRLDLTLAGGGLSAWTHALMLVDDACEPDAGMQALVDEALQPFAAAMREPLAANGAVLHRYAMFESTMDNLLLDATAAAAGTEVALSNGWRYGAPIAPGPITEGDVWNIVPANPPVSVVQLTGRDLRQLYEDNLESTFASDPWKQQGGYLKRCRGLELVIKLENPHGHRVQAIASGGTRVRDDAHVSVAFLGEQAVPRAVGAARRETGITAVEALERYLRRHRSVDVSLRSQIKVV